ncbi:MAG: tRNA 2-thiouridine(34) synthase MnmA [Nanoarchaeota archaeon]|nr:tRNA 2-thiouridine(34) synthase MnmA [Nanoarchaeota archaeon]
MIKEKKTVLLGMSGGVDSSVAALILKKEGYRVIGAFMKNFSDTKNKLTGECAWQEEKAMAQKIAAMLEIPLIIIDSEEEYKKEVVDPMFKAYAKGFTPNPDVLCNKLIKFPVLWKKAQELGVDYIATGHYVRIRKSSKGYEMLRGKDDYKDQSYFLYELNEKDLEHTLFLMGEYTKEEVRKIAKKNGFYNWDKKGTSGVCFIGKIDMKHFLKQRIKEKKGNVVNMEGEVVGTHPGSMFFTIGERVGSKYGIEIDRKIRNMTGKKLYIADKRKGNVLVVAPSGHKALKRNKVFIRELHLINKKEKINGKGLRARIRHLGSLNKGILKKNKGRWIFTFAKPIEGIAEGQSIVFYKGEKVIGGGEMRVK